MEEITAQVLPMLSPADRMWLEALAPEDRLAGLAWLNYKRHVRGWDRKSQPALFMDAFQVGSGYLAAKTAPTPDPLGVG